MKSKSVTNLCRSTIVAGLMIVVSGCQSQTSLEREISQLESVIKQKHQANSAAKETLWQTRAELESIQNEKRLLNLKESPPVPTPPKDGLTSDPDTQQFALKKLTKTWNDRNVAVDSFPDEISQVKDISQPLPKQTHSLVHAPPDPMHTAQLAHRMRPEDLQQNQATPIWATARAMLSWDFILIWISLVPCLILLWAIIQHEVRHEVRAKRRAITNEVKLGLISQRRSWMRLLWNNKLLCVAVAGAIVILLSLSSLRPSKYETLALYRDQLNIRDAALDREANELGEKISTAKKHLTDDTPPRDTLAAHTHDAINHVVGPAANNAKLSQHTSRAKLAEVHESTRRQVANYTHAVGYSKRIGAALTEHQDVAKEKDAELQAYESGARAHARNLIVAKAALVFLFFGINIGLVLTWQRRRKQRTLQTEGTCPKCLSKQSLTPVEEQTESASRTKSATLLKCGNDKCNYLVDESHRKSMRLRIPTAGYTQSGKTVWLTMFHRYVKLGDSKESKLSLALATSPSGSDPRYETVLKALVENRKRPAPTKYDRISDPLLFDFSDSDRFFRSGGILNLFDLGGEATSEAEKGTVEQDRAFRDTQGFLYFIDPTRDDENTLHKQREQLAYFCEEVRRSRGIPYHKPLPVPIAVCVTKLDTFDKEEDSKTAYKEFIDKLDPARSQKRLTLQELRRRHHLVSEYQDHLFPGWELDNLVAKLVGGRFLFFPMSAIGFGNTGDNFATLNFRPFGIVEPVVWLTHMNGYKVL